MHTALLFTNSPQTETDLTRLLREHLRVEVCSVSSLDPTVVPQTAQRQLRSADVVIVDAPSFGAVSRKFIETLASQATTQPVVIRLVAEQTASIVLPESWIISLDTESPQRLRHLIEMLVSQRDLEMRADQLQRLTSQQQQLLSGARERPSATPAAGYVSVAQHRESVKMLSRLLSSVEDVNGLAEKFLELLREQLGLTKLALFLRPVELFHIQQELVQRTNAPMRCIAVLGMGESAAAARAVALSCEDGIGHYVAAEGRILRRSQVIEPSLALFDPHIIREFELLGTEFALPIQDSEITLGVLAFDGKITGEPVAAEDLEYVFALCSTAAAAIKNILLNQQITARQKFSADILEHIQSAVLVVDQHAQIVMSNSNVSSLLGLRPFAGAKHDLSSLPPLVGDLIFETTRTGRCHDGTQVTLPEGRRIIGVRTSRFELPPEGPDGTPRSFVVVLLDDLTQPKAQEALAKQAENNQFWQLLATRLSHEIRNSLVPIRTFAQLLPEKFADAGFRDEFSRTMQTEVGRVDKLVGDIHFFAEPLALNLQTVPLAEVIETAIGRVCAEMWRAAGLEGDFSGVKPSSIVTAKGKTVNIHRHFTHAVAAISADKKRIEDALTHLIRNAIQSMQETGGRLAISTADVADAESSPCGVQISISDTGDGIPVSDLDRIFEPFYTTRNVGVGLGMAIVRKTVDAHRGQIEVDSKLGKGTTIHVSLPASRDVDLSIPESVRMKQRKAVAPPHSVRTPFGPSVRMGED